MINIYHSIFDHKFHKIIDKIKSNNPNLKFIRLGPNNTQLEEGITLSNNDYLMICGWHTKLDSSERNTYLKFIRNKGNKDNIFFIYKNNIGLNISNFTTYKLCFKHIKPHLSHYSFTNHQCEKFNTKEAQTISDWRKNGKYILIAMDAIYGWGAVHTNPVTWASEILSKLYLCNKKILILPHPQDTENDLPNNLKKLAIKNFDAVDPDDLHCSIVYNTNFAIKSIASGIPVISLDRHCLVHEWCDQKLKDINNLNYNIDRIEMLNFLSAIMYTEDELCTFKNIENTITGRRFSLKEYRNNSNENKLFNVIKKYKDIELYKKLHIQNSNYGDTGPKYLERIVTHIQKYKPDSILDFGCGKGGLAKELLKFGLNVDQYDPAIAGKENIPQKHYAMIITTDVLEHLYEDEIQTICNDFLSLSPSTMFHAICTRPASNLLPDGSNAHKTVKPIEWWEDKLKNYTGFKTEAIKNPKEIHDQMSIIVMYK